MVQLVDVAVHLERREAGISKEAWILRRRATARFASRQGELWKGTQERAG